MLNEVGMEIPIQIIKKAEEFGCLKRDNCYKYVYKEGQYGDKFPASSIGSNRATRFRNWESAKANKVDLGEGWVAFKSPSQDVNISNYKALKIKFPKCGLKCKLVIAFIAFTASIFTIFAFVGYPTIYSFFEKEDPNNFNPIMDVTFTNVTFISPTGSYVYNYKSNLNLNIEIWTPHLSKVNIKLINYNFSSEINKHLNYNAIANLSRYSTNYSIAMSDYTYSIDTKHSSQPINIPIEIKNLWISTYDTIYDTSFKVGTITIKIELIDIQNKNIGIQKDYTIPVYWTSRK